MNEEFFHEINISKQANKLEGDFHQLGEKLRSIETNIDKIMHMIENFSNLNEKSVQDNNILKNDDILI